MTAIARNGQMITFPANDKHGQAALLTFMKNMSEGACFGRPTDAQVAQNLGQDFVDFLDKKYPNRRRG